MPVNDTPIIMNTIHSSAAVLAIQILARNDPALAERLHRYKKKLAEGVEQKDRKLKNERN